MRALVVDDEPSLVRVVSGYLEREGFSVRATGDGESALELARESEPDVVVLDLGPGSTGWRPVAGCGPSPTATS
jgi:DNA-binding response OmpR family regulator